MPNGVEIYNADGSLQFGMSSRLFHAIVVINTNGNNGSQTIAGASSAGSIVVVQEGMNDNAQPTVTISGDTVSWDFGSNTPKQATILKVLVY